MRSARGGARPRLGHQLGRSGCHVEDRAATKACQSFCPHCPLVVPATTAEPVSATGHIALQHVCGRPLKASQSHTAAGAALAWPQLEQLPLQPETREQAACCAQGSHCIVRCLSLRCKASLQWPNCLQGQTPRPSTKQGNSPVTFYESCVDMFVKSFVARFNSHMFLTRAHRPLAQRTGVGRSSRESKAP